MDAKVTVWYDRTSQDHAWIVSRDDQTLAATDSEGIAIGLGRRYARLLGLPLVVCDLYGAETAIDDD